MPSVLGTSDGIRLRTCRIENHGFNELVEGWHADHVWKHDAAAIECFLLMTFLALILFHAFLYLNVKPSLRQGKSKDFWARVMAAEIYQDFIRSGLSMNRTVRLSNCLASQIPAFLPA